MKPIMASQTILHMKEGDGESSYAKNSILQRRMMSKALPIIKDAIKNMFVNHSTQFGMLKSLAVADLGCASGSNTLLLVSEVINSVHESFNQENDKTPEILVVLNDLYTNDFNNIFTSLPEFYEQLKEKFGDEFSHNCFITGVPASFYERLLPCKSLHFVHSSSSLHWLSQVPNNLINKDHICFTNACAPNVFDSYKEQFHKDFSTFLHHRACEIVPNGRMILTFMGRPFQDPSKDDSCYFLELLGQSLYDVASQGLIKKEDVDSFNLPLYAPYKDEVQDVIREEKSFDLEKMEIFEFNWDAEDDDYNDYNKFDKRRSGQNVANYIRAISEPMMLIHFGEFIFINNVFERYAERVADHLTIQKAKIMNLTICLRKK